uniref:Pleiotropic regulator 1 n=1 Tax=Salmo trutta TaxID=8032 RepID=A0A674E2F9_SALTR
MTNIAVVESNISVYFIFQDVQKHSVHTLVFRSLKRTHDMFVADHAKPVSLDETRYSCFVKQYAVFVLPSSYSFLCEIKISCVWMSPVCVFRIDIIVSDPTLAYRVALTADTQIHRNPSKGGVHAMALALPPSQARYFLQMMHGRCVEVRRHQSKRNSISLLEGGGTKNSSLVARKAPTMPKPQWHAPWKLFRVISGHLGWVRSIAVEPGNQWFVTGAGDRTIKIWDLASGKLKLSLTGHISTVRGVAVSTRSPYLFSCGEDKQVKCWDLEYNKVIRHYHGHLSAVYDLDLHPTIDVLVTCSRDATARVWDIRSKANVHTLSGHTNTVATVRCQAAEPQIITGSHDSTIRLWDLIAGKTRATLTNHKKSVRALALHPRQYTLASGSADNIKQWTFPDGNFIQNLSGHNAIINAMAVNSDGVLVSGADNGTIHLWDWRTGYNFQRIHAAVQPGSLDSESGIFACMFDHSESRLITAEADKTIKVYKEDDTATEESHPINWKPEILKRKRF